MLKPSIDKLLEKVNSKYSLCILESKRAHELAEGEEATIAFKSVKNTLRALEEIEAGTVTIHPDPELKRELIRQKIEEEKRRKEEEERKIQEQIAQENERAEKERAERSADTNGAEANVEVEEEVKDVIENEEAEVVVEEEK
jgi:DNA-directed RNA polymerase subunit omega